MKTTLLTTCLILLSLILSSHANCQNVALDFDGVDDYLSSTDAGISGNNPRTIEAWILTTKNSVPAGQGGNGQSTIVDWGTFVNSGRSTFNVLFNNAIRFEVGGNGVNGSIAVNDGQWHHVAMTYDPLSNPSVYLYVDGVLDVSGNLTVPVSTGTGNNITIGRRIDNVNYFEGGIDEVRVYNYAKTLPQINADRMNELCGTHDPGLVAYYKMNEGAPGAMNASNDTALNYVNFASASLNNFALSGTNSNWINGPVIARGNSYSTLAVSLCGSLSSPSGNYVWTSSGSYQDTIPNSVLCDSIITVNLEILQSDTSYAVVACDSFISATGNVYTISGNYTDTLFNASSQGCDSIVQIQLSIDNGSFTMIDTSGCGSLNYNGTAYFNSTILSDTLQNTNGCDSIVQVNITVNPIQSQTDSLYACDSVLFNGTWYYSNQQLQDNYSSTAGCDSTVNTFIFVNQSIVTSDSLFACDSILINGVWYDSTQTITVMDTTSLGCDSTHVSYLTVNSIEWIANQASSWEVILNTVPGIMYAWYDCSTNALVDTSSTFYAPYIGQFYAELVLENCSVQTPCFSLGEGILDIYNDNFDLYPNPNNGSFFVDFGEIQSNMQVQLIDYSGRLVYEEEFDKLGSFTLSTSLVPGMYYFIGKSEKANFAKAFVIH